MIRSIWNLFLAIFARPAKSNDYLDCVEDVPIMHFYPIPEDIKEYSKEEIRSYANELTEFILKKFA
jgi:hypothetical protein